MKVFTHIVLVLTLLATLAGIAFIFVQRSPSDSGFELVLPAATVPPQANAKVYVSGAVQSPGVYVMLEGGRVIDAVELAGGATHDADLTAVNLATRERDEDHWHLPRLGESVETTSAQGTSSTKKTDMNSATEEELKSLPNIGEVKAQAIIRYREANGPFSRLEDLLEARGIGGATLDAFRDLAEVR